MPAHRRKQSNAMLYTLIIFVGLFIGATTVAVVYYVKAEENRIAHDELQAKFEDFASNEEEVNVGSIVGQQLGRSTWLGTMVKHFDGAVSMILGGAAESTSAEVKYNNAIKQKANLLETVQDDIGVMDPNLTGFLQIANALKQKLNETNATLNNTKKLLADTQTEFDAKQKANLENYQTLLDEKKELLEEYTDKKAAYDDLEELLKEETDDQVQSLYTQLERERANLKAANDNLLETQAKLTESQTMIASLEEELNSIEPGPSRDAMAYEPDGKIISVDNEAKIAYLNIGSNDKIYRGLHLAVYDRGTSIKEEGLGKAEVEIFDISDSYSAARIIRSEINKPILEGDMIANLIWDSKKVNEFVIAGDFDLDDDGYIDSNAKGKIEALVKNWGGKVTDKITIDTDYLILGKQPQVLAKPTVEEQEADPTIMQKYETAVKRMQEYSALQDRANSLWVPIFSFEKFIQLIGYTEKIGQAGAF